MQLDMTPLTEWVDSAAERGAIAVVTHRNGDMDTIGSGIVLARRIENARACGLYVGTLARKMLDGHSFDFMQIDADRPAFPRSLGGIIVVDCASPSQVGFTLPDAPLCVVDHHSSASDPWPEDALILRGNASSTAEMVWDWIRDTDLVCTAEDATLLLAAIISDTGRFKHSRAGCHRRVDEISEASGIDPVDVIEKMESEDLSHSQRIAILKAVGRCESHQIGDLVVATTRASTHEGVVAHALLASGAHVALVHKKTPDGLRVTGRASRTGTQKGADIGSVMKTVAGRLGGEGGGHPGAAGWSGQCHPVELQSTLLAALTSELIR